MGKDARTGSGSTGAARRWRTDREHLTAMRALGVKWPAGRAIPTYPPTMDARAMQAADEHYDAMAPAFVERHGGRK